MAEVDAKEKFKMIEMENSNLKSTLRQLEAQVNDCFHVKLQKDIVDKKLSGLKMEMLKQQRRNRKSKTKVSKFRKEIIDKDSLIEKMSQHVKKIWILLLAFGNKLGKNGLLTIEEKSSIKNEYEEWFTLMATLDKGETEEVLKMLNKLPTSLFEVLNISECESEISPPQFSNEEDVISSSILPTLKDKSSSNNSGLGKTDHTTQDKSNKKPQTISHNRLNNWDQVTQRQVMKKPNVAQCRSKHASRINQYKAILQKNSSFSDNSLLLHSTIASNFQSKATVKTSKKNDIARAYPAESKRTAILLPGPPIKISQRVLVDKKDIELTQPSLKILPSDESSKRTCPSKSYDFHSNKKQKVTLNASPLDEAPVRVKGRILENRMILGKQNSQTESSIEITEQSECNKNLGKVDQTLENESGDVQNNSGTIYDKVGKPKKNRKDHTKSLEKTISDSVVENKNKKLFDSNMSDSASYKQPSYVTKCATTTKDIPKILEQQTFLHTLNINESIYSKEQKHLADKKIIAIDSCNHEHISVETEHTNNDNLPQNIIPYFSFNSPSKNKGLCQTNYEILTANTESTFFNPKISVSNEEVSISTKGSENLENHIERNSDYITEQFTSKNFNTNEKYVVSDEEKINNVGNIKMGFTSGNGNSASDSEGDLVIDEDFDDDKHLISKDIHNASGEEIKIAISKDKYILDCDPDSKSVVIAENVDAIEQSIIPKVKNVKSLDAIRNDISNGKESDSYPSCNPSYSKEDINSLRFMTKMLTFSDNYGSSTSAEDTECENIKTCHNKIESVVSKDFPPEQIEKSSKLSIEIEYKPGTISVNEQSNFPSACVKEESKIVKETFDVGTILKLQAETLKSKGKNKILEKDLQEKSRLTFFKMENSAIKLNNQHNKKGNALQKRKNMKKKSQKVGMASSENSLNIKNFNLQSKTPDFNRKNQILKKVFPVKSNSTFAILEHSNDQSTNNRKKEKKKELRRKKNLMKKNIKNSLQYAGNPLHDFFQDFKKIQFTQENFEQNVENLFLLFIDPSKTPNNSSLLFHISNYLRISKIEQNPLLSHSCEDLSLLFPLDENCIVTTMFLIELEKKPHLEGLLNTAITTFHHIIISKKKFSVLILASFCRVFTQICKCQGNNLKPVLLCGDLLKMKHQFAPYLIASITSVWKELFQIGNNLPAEEVLFHSSILYGASKKTKLTPGNWDSSIKIISKYFTALPVNDARSAIHMLIELTQLRCKDDSWNNHYLATSLIILAAHEDWDWTEEILLNKYIVPNLTKFGSETLNENAFDFYCNMYVDAFLLKPGNPLDTVLSKFFDSSEIFEGGNSVQESAALGLMRFVYLKNRKLPPFLSSWFKSNSEKPKVQNILPYFQRRLTGVNLYELREEDVVSV